jgi:hypothetical protein
MLNLPENGPSQENRMILSRLNPALNHTQIMQQKKYTLYESNYFSPSFFSQDGYSTVIFTLLLAVPLVT